MTRPAVGIVLTGVGDLSGGGGAERFFSDLFSAFERTAERRQFEPWLICDASAIRQLRAIGRLPESPRRIDLSDWGTGRAATAISLYRLATGGRFALLHLSLPTPRHLPWLWLALRHRKRAALAFNVNDFEVAARLRDAPAPRGLDLAWRTYLAYFDMAGLDGVMVWYRALEAALRARPAHPRLIRSIRRYAVDTSRFAPAVSKEDIVVFAGRLVGIKRPELFIDAIALARARDPIIERWRFLMLGKGPLEESLRRLASSRGLDDLLTISFAADTREVLSRARVFVSTQDQENFTSLAMLEAMACGNAILARNVGQTADFVSHGRNGWLVADDAPESLADALLRVLKDPATIDAWGAESYRVTREVHCEEAMLSEFDAFWRDTIAQRT